MFTFFTDSKGQGNQDTKHRVLTGVLHILQVSLLIFLFGSIFITTGSHPVNAQSVQDGSVGTVSLDHTSKTVNENCKDAYFSRDGNPFQLCPGPFPGGGNCVWWAWEQWHLLGYDLPLNWGNAADWAVDAERAGLSVGFTPRVGAIAVFPRNDGVWAYSDAGHVAFVTGVSDDLSTFNVTYQNYGDSKPMYIGLNYPVERINEPRFQNNELRFIYFPQLLAQSLFARLPGINGNDLSGMVAANSQYAATAQVSHPTLGLPGGSGTTDQEFNADFTGNGKSDLLLYNRQQGSLSIVNFTSNTKTSSRITDVSSQTRQAFAQTTPVAQRSYLSDAKTSANGWGSKLDVRVGDFTGTGTSDILLYDRTNGTIQILTLTPQLTIKQHLNLPGWGANWELYTGRFDGQHDDLFLYNRFADANVPLSVTPSASSPQTTLDQWNASNRTATVVLLDFNSDLSVHHLQQYTYWHNSWEVYIGRYKNTNQDGVFLYDRSIGEARIMDFSPDLTINDYTELHDLKGNWQIFSGDFNGSGRAQVMLYEPSKGLGAFLVFNSDLTLQRRQDYTGWTPNEVFYVGHFGTDRLNAMLYDPQKGTSTFIVFNDALKILTLHTVQSWNSNWQILIGAFTGNSICMSSANCKQDDDILALNRTNGQIQQFAFTFGGQYKEINNRARAFEQLHKKGSLGSDLVTVDTTSFQTVATFDTSIRGEEVY
ncbi:MAG TPA: hypothetical protein DHW02_15320 [Ktedonobacter sp.]|nr:hypothetical protein [Ktedonobacter sp.]